MLESSCFLFSVSLFVLCWKSSQGLWIDLEVSYKGSFQMTLETKMNLTRLGKESDSAKEEGYVIVNDSCTACCKVG